jgi:hypothetical protein
MNRLRGALSQNPGRFETVEGAPGGDRRAETHARGSPWC